MPAVARSEPFRGQGPCPLGICDGSGWILDDADDEARPCECREARLRRGRNRGVASVIPRKFQGVSFEPAHLRRRARRRLLPLLL